VQCGSGTNHGFLHCVTGETHRNASSPHALTFAPPEKHRKISLFFCSLSVTSIARMLLQLEVAPGLALVAATTREASQESRLRGCRLGLPLIHERRPRIAFAGLGPEFALGVGREVLDARVGPAVRDAVGIRIGTAPRAVRGCTPVRRRRRGGAELRRALG